jgi:hypothetical protein
MKPIQEWRRLTLVVITVVACGRGESRQTSKESAVAAANGAASVTAATGPRASWPKDGCAWIPVADVEAILGKLAGPPEAHRVPHHGPRPVAEIGACS